MSLFNNVVYNSRTEIVKFSTKLQVSVSMLEIYNETVKDLLNVSSFKKGGLRVREHPQKGFYGSSCPCSASTLYTILYYILHVLDVNLMQCDVVALCISLHYYCVM